MSETYGVRGNLARRHLGERTGRSKLTADAVRAIRRRADAGEALATIAADYDVTDDRPVGP